MKTYLIVIVLSAAAITAANAQAQKQTFTAPLSRPKHQLRPPPAPISQKPEVDGVIPRAVRGGNPLQMLNPRAPRKYGTAQEAVTYNQYPCDPYDPYRWRGIKFFEFRF